MFDHIHSILAYPVFYLTGALFTPEGLRTFCVVGGFFALVVFEACIAYRGNSAKAIAKSYTTNIGTFIFNDVLMSLLSVSSLFAVAEHYADKGILRALDNAPLQAVLSLVLLDLVLYLWHWANHNIDGLWLFHRVHHSDRCMNVSTAFRLHFVEVLLTTAVKALYIVALGVSTAVLLANEVVIVLFVMFHHANIKLGMEHWLGRLLIVPSLHRVHHSVLREEHDHNYGAVFSIWDRVFGTLAELEPAELGLRGIPEQGFIELMGSAWARFAPPVSDSPQLQTMIAEAAYYKAEKRNFAPGHTFLDWLEAESEVKNGQLSRLRVLIDRI